MDEVEASLATFGDRYRQRLFTQHELETCGDGPKAASELAARFAAKEAVIKILLTDGVIPTWKSVEVRRSASGQLEIALYDGAVELARALGVQSFSVSLSHAGGVATAAVVATLES